MDTWDYEEYLEQLDYQPQNNHCFDLWQYEGSKGTEIREGVIESGNSESLRCWIEEEPRKNCGQGDGLIGRLRLLYSYVDPGVGTIHDKPVFWKREDFEKILCAFHLPKRYSQVLGAEHTIFAAFHPEDATGRFAYIFSTFFHHHPFWSVAASYDHVTKTTSALLHCASSAGEESLKRLKGYLKSMAPSILHPLLLPILIADLETSLTLRDCEEWKTELGAVEADTGQNPNDTHGVGMRSLQQVNPLGLDFVVLLHRLNACSVFVRIIERECEGVLEQLVQMREAIGLASGPDWATPDDSSFKRNEERRLRAHVDFLLTSRKVLLIRLHEIQRGAQTQLAVVYNFTAQRDNKLNIEIARDSKSLAIASKRDSSAMKTIALLTTVFLPGTFVASFFAMPLFDWQASSSQIVTRPNFWVYWAVTIPLTLLVLSIWAVWIRVVNHRHEKEDEIALRSYGGPQMKEE